jgi:hypothetical protein
MSELLRLVSPQKATFIFRYSRLALIKAILGSNSLQVKAWNSRNADGQRLFRRAFEGSPFLLSGKLVNMADDLATLSTKINTTEEKIEKLERHIANNDFAGTPFDDRAEAKAALKDLRAKEAALQNEKVALQNKKVELLKKENLLLKVALQNEKVELLKKENLLLQQQQQSGAGTSMLPMRQEDVISPSQKSCCIHEQTWWRLENALLHATLHSCGLLFSTSTALRA